MHLSSKCVVIFFNLLLLWDMCWNCKKTGDDGDDGRNMQIIVQELQLRYHTINQKVVWQMGSITVSKWAFNSLVHRSLLTFTANFHKFSLYSCNVADAFISWDRKCDKGDDYM